mmetsp:Transcript_17156/g.19647  ORF Transcript_17156/g.19647 Transcript_17156/m.19647 type:complete len:212 (-) Transcript_17156:162-797(-)
MESGEQPGHILRRKYKQIWTKKLAQNLKEGKYTGKIEILNRRVNENEIDMIENKVEYDEEEDGVTREAQQQKCKNATPNTDSTNDSICNSSTSASKNNDMIKNTGGAKTVTNTDTNTVTTNDEVNKGEEEEKEAELEADANSKILNNSNDIGSSNSESDYVATKSLKRPDKNENESRMTGNNTGYDGENPCETTESKNKNNNNNNKNVEIR